jgi:hypothetical protein
VSDIEHELIATQWDLKVAKDHIKRLEAFVNRFLDPEDLGYAVNKCLRDDAREALGRSRVESPSKEKKP